MGMLPSSIGSTAPKNTWGKHDETLTKAVFRRFSEQILTNGVAVAYAT
jgi:hypothetical protein